MRILVCGGRDFSNEKLLGSVLNSYFYGPEDCLICGMARGADMLAHKYVSRTDSHIEEYPADWEKYGKSAGPIRNQKMLDEGTPDLVVAFPGGRGTANMISLAKKAGIKVMEISE